MNQDLNQKQNKKYQDALDYISDDWKCNLAESFNEGGIDEEEYNESLKSYDLLQELVDKATPEKPLIAFIDGAVADGSVVQKTIVVCPSCKSLLVEGQNYCTDCGQAIDFGEDDE